MDTFWGSFGIFDILVYVVWVFTHTLKSDLQNLRIQIFKTVLKLKLCFFVTVLCSAGFQNITWDKTSTNVNLQLFYSSQS